MPELPHPNVTTPAVLVPVTAEDEARAKRRIILACVTASVVILGTAGWIYKRSLDPIHAQQELDSGRRLLAIARYNQAILSFDRASALKPDLEEAYLLRGRARVGLYAPDQAIEDFSKAIALRPSDTQALLERGRAFVQLKNYAAALDDATAALAIDPKLGAAHNLRGTALRDTGKPEAALAEFDRAVELAPNADNYYQRGATHQALGQYALAIADFDRTIEFQPYMAQGYFARAESRRALGDDKGAEQDHLQGRILDGR